MEGNHEEEGVGKNGDTNFGQYCELNTLTNQF